MASPASTPITLNVVQDIATPHNNVLLSAINETPGINLNLWYCQHNPEKYGWTTDLTNAVKPANLYNPNKIDWSFIRYCLTHSNEHFLIVGWMNPSTRLLFILFWLLRRPFNVWFDFPQDEATRSPVKRTIREFFYFILKTSRAKVFGVGEMTVNYFKQRGFAANRLVNLPIFIDVSKSREDFADKRSDIRKKYNVTKSDLFLSTGSRLVFDKGFDVLINAIGALPEKTRKHVKAVIVGKGEEKDNLTNLIKQHNLEGQVTLEEWMPFPDFQALIAASDALVHPARFDAFGASIFGLALGTPVIGSTTAGAVIDRVRDGENGFTYPNNDPKQLASVLEKCLQDRESLEELSPNARATALKWTPTNGVSILQNNLI